MAIPLFLLTTVLATCQKSSADVREFQVEAPDVAPHRGCTIFIASIGGSVLFGKNEDYPAYSDDEHNIRILPKEPDRYGAVLWFYKNIGAQGGVNEVGFAIDNSGLPPIELALRDDLPLSWPKNVIHSAIC